MIEPRFTFFQVQLKGRLADTSEFIEPHFCDSPKVLNAINMIRAGCKFIDTMLHTIVLPVTKVYQAVIGAKSIGIDSRVLSDFLLYNGHQRALRAVSHHLGVYLGLSGFWDRF